MPAPFGTAPGFPGYHHDDEPVTREPSDAATRRQAIPVRRDDPGGIPRMPHGRGPEIDRVPTVLRKSGEVPSIDGAAPTLRYVVRRADELPAETMVVPFGSMRSSAQIIAGRFSAGEMGAADSSWAPAGDQGNGWCIVDTAVPVARTDARAELTHLHALLLEAAQTIRTLAPIHLTAAQVDDLVREYERAGEGRP